MKKILLLLALIVAAFAGCVEEEPSVEELKALMIDASQNVETMNFEMESDQVVTATNLSETDESLRTETVTTSSVGEGVLNITDRALKMTMVTTSSSKEEVEEFVQEMEMYMIEGTMYMKIDGNWTRMPGMPADLWDKQNQLSSQVEMLNNSEIELMGSEKVDGEDAYKLRIVPDMEQFATTLGQQMGDMPLFGVNLTELFTDSEMEQIVWLSKESYLPLKAQTDMRIPSMKMTFSPELMGLPPGAMETQEIEMGIESSSTVIYRDYNQPVLIELPEEAKNAPSLLEMIMMQAAQAQ